MISPNPSEIIAKAMLPGALPSPEMEGSQWESLWVAARDHCLTPYLFRRWSESGSIGALPEGIRSKFEAAVARNRERNRRILLELAHVMERLRNRGIEVLVLKGLSLAQAYYGEVGQRVLYDLDLLVPPEAFRSACETLLSDGYGFYFGEPLQDQDTGLLWRPRKYDWDAEHVFDPERPLLLEVHVRPWAPRWHGFDVKCRIDMWSGTTELAADEVVMRVPGPEKLVVQLCVHYAFNLLESNARLMHLLDVGLMIRERGSALDWDAIVAEMRANGVRAFSFMTLDLARRICAAPVPEEIMEALRRHTPSKIARWLEDEGVPAAHSMNLHRRDPRLIYRLHWKMASGWRERLQVIGYSIQTPWKERRGKGGWSYFIARMTRRLFRLAGLAKRSR